MHAQTRYRGALVGLVVGFAGAVLVAANLGDDADTTAAVVGQLAGAFHGEAGIPVPWLARIHLGHEIAALADSLLQRNMSQE